jgi:hypothetical protein
MGGQWRKSPRWAAGGADPPQLGLIILVVKLSSTIVKLYLIIVVRSTTLLIKPINGVPCVDWKVRESGVCVSITQTRVWLSYLTSYIIIIIDKWYVVIVIIVMYKPAFEELIKMHHVHSREYSQKLASHWSQTENILNSWRPIGHKQRIFSAAGIPLVTTTVYSQCLTFH